MDKRQEQADSISDLRRLLNDYLHVLDENWAAYGDGTLNEELITFGDAVDSILRLIQPIMPEIPELPLLTDEQQKKIINKNKEMGGRHFYAAGKRLVEAQRDLIMDALRKAGYTLPVPDEERREKIAEFLYYEKEWFGSWNGFKFSDIPNDWIGKIQAYQQADSILRLIQPTLPELPLLMDEQIAEVWRFAIESPDRNMAESMKDYYRRKALIEAQRDLCLETLKKAGYEERK